MKSLTKFLFAATLLFSISSAFAKSHTTTINIAGNSTIVDRHLSGFKGIAVGGSFDVYVTQGVTESVKVEAPADKMDKIITEVNGGILKIYNKKGNDWIWGWGKHAKTVIYVTVKELNTLTVSGSGDVFFKDGISGNSLKVQVSGSGDVSGKLSVKTLESSVSGSGDIKVSGRAETSSVTVSGSGDFSARNLITASTTVRVSGSGDADVNATESINATAHGSGDIKYSGGAKKVTQSKSGSGDIHRY
jgi:hypothetical protein